MLTSKKKSIISLVITVSLIVGQFATTNLTVRALGQSDITSPIIHSLVNESTTNLTSGISEKQITYVGSDGNRVECFTTDVDLKIQILALP